MRHEGWYFYFMYEEFSIKHERKVASHAALSTCVPFLSTHVHKSGILSTDVHKHETRKPLSRHVIPGCGLAPTPNRGGKAPLSIRMQRLNRREMSLQVILSTRVNIAREFSIIQ